MSWLLIIILAYFFLAIASLVDRYLLAGPLSNPGAYAFFVGLLGGLSLILVPFGFSIPNLSQIALSLLTGAAWTLALFLFYLAITKSEVSRAVPAIGGFLPLFTFFISFVFFPKEMKVSLFYGFAFLFLILGSVLITLEKGKGIALKNLGLSILTAFVFGLGFFLSKLVYLEQSFISGFIWIRMGGALAALFFLFSSQIRQAVFKQKLDIKKQISIPFIFAASERKERSNLLSFPSEQEKKLLGFIFGQACGSFGVILQNYSISLAEINQLPIINALEGVRYVFLLFFVLILGRKFSHFLKEEVSKQAFLQKTLAILFISAGLVLLALKQ